VDACATVGAASAAPAGNQAVAGGRQQRRGIAGKPGGIADAASRTENGHQRASGVTATWRMAPRVALIIAAKNGRLVTAFSVTDSIESIALPARLLRCAIFTYKHKRSAEETWRRVASALAGGRSGAHLAWSRHHRALASATASESGIAQRRCSNQPEENLRVKMAKTA